MSASRKKKERKAQSAEAPVAQGQPVKKGMSRGLKTTLIVVCAIVVIAAVVFFSMVTGGYFASHTTAATVGSHNLTPAMVNYFYNAQVYEFEKSYGSYLGKQEHLQRNALIVCGADTLIALMAGMAVMPACSAFGVEYGAGPGLLFASMQTVFAHMGSVGNFIGFLFYLLVLIAALTSSISMLELCTAYAVDKQLDKGLTPKRAKHTASVAALVFVAGSLVALDGLGAGVSGGAAVETPATLFGLSVHGWNDCWLDLYDMVAEGILMPLGALVMTILIGWVLKPEVVQLECEQSGVKYRAAGYFKVCFKFIVPVLLAFILFCQLIDFFGLKIPGLS